MKALYISLSIFFWSVWEFYDGNHTMAYFLIAISVYTLLAGGFVFLFANNILLDKIFFNTHNISEPVYDMRKSFGDIIRQNIEVNDLLTSLYHESLEKAASLRSIKNNLVDLSENSRNIDKSLADVSFALNEISRRLR
jgi:hypothetical protein